MNINPIRGAVKKLANTDHVANGVVKKRMVEVTAIKPKKAVHATVTCLV
jgi:hypothetical protein